MGAGGQPARLILFFHRCPERLFFYKNRARFSRTTLIMSAEHQVPFGFLLAQSQWLMAPVAALISFKERAPFSMARMMSSSVTLSQ